MIFFENCTKSVLKTSHFFRNASLLEAIHFLSHIDFSRSVNPIRSSLLQRFFYQNSHLYRSTALYQIPALCQNTFLCWRTARFQKCSSLYGCFSLIETLSFSYFIHWCSYNSRSRKIAIKQYKKGWITELLWILSLLRLNFQLFEYFFYFLLAAFSIASLYYDVASDQFWILCSAF